MITFLVVLAIFIYILLGWFIRGLIQDDWDEPSFLLVILWPLVILAYSIIRLFEITNDLAIKIKEKEKDGKQ